MDRLTKQDLKAPDKILIASRSAFAWAEQQWALLLGAVGAIFLTVLGISVFIQYQAKQEAKAQVVYGKAKAFFEQTKVGGEKEKAEAKANLQKELTQLKKDFSNSKAAGMAGLLWAQMAMEEKKYAEAIAALESFLKVLPRTEKDLAAYPLAVAYEQSGDWAKAFEAYHQLTKNEKTAYLQEAYLGKARAERRLQRKEDAKRTYEKFLEKFPQSAEVAVVRGLLSELNTAK